MRMLEKILQVFSYNQLKTFQVLSHVTSEAGFSQDDVLAYIVQVETKQIEAIQAQEEGRKNAHAVWDKIAPRCPLCDSALLLRAITIRQGKANINGYKSHFYCSNDDCLYEQYSRVSAEYQYKKLLKKRKEGK